MTKTQMEKCAKIAKYYGEISQLSILVEEMAELIVAVSKTNREIPDADKKMLDGVADVSIMLQQVISFMDEDERTALSKKINEKLDARLNIIAEEQEK